MKIVYINNLLNWASSTMFVGVIRTPSIAHGYTTEEAVIVKDAHNEVAPDCIVRDTEGREFFGKIVEPSHE